MKFIDRTRELQRLNDSLSDTKNKLIVVYGRRRLGKSTLIRKVLKAGDVYYEATKSEVSYKPYTLQTLH